MSFKNFSGSAISGRNNLNKYVSFFGTSVFLERGQKIGLKVRGSLKDHFLSNCYLLRRYKLTVYVLQYFQIPTHLGLLKI
jgi:hypothetical protein